LRVAGVHLTLTTSPLLRETGATEKTINNEDLVIGKTNIIDIARRGFIQV